MKSALSKIVTVLVIGLLVFGGYMIKKNSPEEQNKQQDYQTLQLVADATGKALGNTSPSDFDKPVQNEWYQFELSILYANPNQNDLYFKFDRQLRDELGENFPTRLLSTGEPIVVRLQPTLGQYEIHVGNTCNGDTMVYPYWKYKGLPKK